MKWRQHPEYFDPEGRAPQGARGLKCLVGRAEGIPGTSRPARGAWIEILESKNMSIEEMVAPRKGRVD